MVRILQVVDVPTPRVRRLLIPRLLQRTIQHVLAVVVVRASCEPGVGQVSKQSGEGGKPTHLQSYGCH